MQIKFLKDSKNGKVVTKNHSRGVAFVEFTEHEHALVALRVLNNNPGNLLYIISCKLSCFSIILVQEYLIDQIAACCKTILTPSP